MKGFWEMHEIFIMKYFRAIMHLVVLKIEAAGTQKKMDEISFTIKRKNNNLKLLNAVPFVAMAFYDFPL